MHKLFYQSLKQYVNFGLHLFFKKIKVVGKENIPNNGAVLFVANHQNALIDALLLVTQIQRKTHFVARADVFKRPIVKKMLALIYMMPIYRITDGRQSMSKNDEILDKCKQILLNEEGLMIFPEGNHNLQRRLRPLSKGFTRIVFSALADNPKLNLKIVPVGLNYTHHQYYRGSVSLYFGKPINAADYVDDDFNKASLTLKEATANRLKTLITHVENAADYIEQITRLEAGNPDYLNPLETNLKLKNLGDQKEPSGSKSSNTGLFSALIKILKAPIWFNNLLPLTIWSWIKAKIKDPVMIASIKFCVGITVFPIFYLLQAIIVTHFLDGWVGLAYFIFSIISLPILSNPRKGSDN